MLKSEEIIPIEYLKASNLHCLAAHVFISSEGSVAHLDSGTWLNKQWQSVSKPTDSYATFSLGFLKQNNDSYIVGAYTNKQYRIVPNYWKNGIFNKLPLTTAVRKFERGMAQGISFIGNSLIIGGHVEKNRRPGGEQACLWINDKLILLNQNEDTPFKYSRVFKVFGHNGDHYAIGMNCDQFNKSYAGYWKNGEWIEVESGRRLKIGVDSIGYDENTNELILVGIKHTHQQQPGMWRSNSWIPFEKLGTTHNPTDIVFGSDGLYVSGEIYGNNTRIPGYWKNGQWFSLPTLIKGHVLSGSARSINFINGKLIVGGAVYDEISNTTRACVWEDGRIILFPMNVNEGRTSVLELL